MTKTKLHTRLDAVIDAIEAQAKTMPTKDAAALRKSGFTAVDQILARVIEITPDAADIIRGKKK